MSGQNWNSLRTTVHLLTNKICPKCLSKMIEMEVYHNHSIWACMYCDLPQEDVDCFYESVCWSCGSDIDSRTCRRSNTPTMGYHCNLCGKDLTEWKLKRRALYESSIQQGVHPN